jgi:hypothetical protein
MSPLHCAASITSQVTVSRPIAHAGHRSVRSSMEARRKMHPSMRALRPFAAVNQGLVWLALLLLLAHSAAILHGYSHLAPEAASYEDDQGAPLAAHCGLCLTAASVSGGALPADSPGLSLSAARHAVPPAQVRSSWLAPLALAYLSRAPPLAPR